MSKHPEKLDKMSNLVVKRTAGESKWQSVPCSVCAVAVALFGCAILFLFLFYFSVFFALISFTIMRF